jgi:pyridoxine kinase
MPTILSLSSQVARGHVGHSAAVFAWQRLGIDVIALPTIILSNRPDLPHRAGERVRPELLGEMIAAIDANGWLGSIDAVFTGYLPSPEHVTLAANLVERLKLEKPDLIFCCDPILGDEPDGLYIAKSAAEAIRAEILPLADIVTPNRFELGWLAGREIASRADALAAARALGRIVLATSSPADTDAELANILFAEGRAWQAVVARRSEVPHGSGDALAALFLGFLLRSRTAPDALALATGSIEVLIGVSEGKDELDLIASQDAWAIPAPWPITALTDAEP